MPRSRRRRLRRGALRDRGAARRRTRCAPPSTTRSRGSPPTAACARIYERWGLWNADDRGAARRPRAAERAASPRPSKRGAPPSASPLPLLERLRDRYPRTLPLFARGALLTLALSFVAMALAVPLGVVLALRAEVRAARRSAGSRPATSSSCAARRSWCSSSCSTSASPSSASRSTPSSPARWRSGSTTPPPRPRTTAPGSRACPVGQLEASWSLGLSTRAGAPPRDRSAGGADRDPADDQRLHRAPEGQLAGVAGDAHRAHQDLSQSRQRHARPPRPRPRRGALVPRDRPAVLVARAPGRGAARPPSAERRDDADRDRRRAPRRRPHAPPSRRRASRRCATSRSPCPRARSRRSSARAAPARRRCCAASPASTAAERGTITVGERTVAAGRAARGGAARPRRPGLPDLRALPAPERARELRARADAACAGVARAAAEADGARAARAARPRRQGRRPPVPALRRSMPARRDRPRARHGARVPALRRADERPRPGAQARGDRDPGDVRAARHDADRGHPRRGARRGRRRPRLPTRRRPPRRRARADGERDAPPCSGASVGTCARPGARERAVGSRTFGDRARHTVALRPPHAPPRPTPARRLRRSSPLAAPARADPLSRRHHATRLARRPAHRLLRHARRASRRSSTSAAPARRRCRSRSSSTGRDLAAPFVHTVTIPVGPGEAGEAGVGGTLTIDLGALQASGLPVAGRRRLRHRGRPRGRADRDPRAHRQLHDRQSPDRLGLGLGRGGPERRRRRGHRPRPAVHRARRRARCAAPSSTARSVLLPPIQPAAADLAVYYDPDSLAPAAARRQPGRSSSPSRTWWARRTPRSAPRPNGARRRPRHRRPARSRSRRRPPASRSPIS